MISIWSIDLAQFATFLHRLCFCTLTYGSGTDPISLFTLLLFLLLCCFLWATLKKHLMLRRGRNGNGKTESHIDKLGYIRFISVTCIALDLLQCQLRRPTLNECSLGVCKDLCARKRNRLPVKMERRVILNPLAVPVSPECPSYFIIYHQIRCPFLGRWA